VVVVGAVGAECVERVRVRAATGWGVGLRGNKKGRAGMDRWGESKGVTRCSHRYC
jgi:hypothetical protein